MAQAKGWYQKAFIEKVLLSDYFRGLGFRYSKRANSLGMISEAVIF